MVNNHTSVWGSFYDRRTGKWGFRCCHSVIRNSYCTGEEGRRANEQHISELGAFALLLGLDRDACMPSSHTYALTDDHATPRHITPHHPTAASTRAKPTSEGDAANDGEGGDGGGKKKGSTLTSTLTMRSELYGTDAAPTDLDEEKLKAARKKQREFQKAQVETDDRKRKYNSMSEAEVTKEDMEAYRMEKRHADDPMANFKDDELLEG